MASSPLFHFLFPSFFFPHQRAWTTGTLDTFHVRGTKILMYPRDNGRNCRSLESLAGSNEYLKVDELEVSCLYLSSKTVQHMMDVIERQGITKLILRSCQAHPKILQKLLSLDRHHDASDDNHIRIRPGNQQIRHLEIHKTSTLDQHVMETICRCLPNLESLTLNTNQNLQFLFPLLSTIQSLRSLNLNGSQLDLNERVVQELAKFLEESSRHQQSLQHISLKCCQLSDESVRKVVLAMRNLQHLERLELVGNSCCYQGLNALGHLLESSSGLAILDVSYQVGEFTHVRLFARALQTNTSLKVLRIAGNSLGNDKVRLIARSLAKNSSLHDLDLSANSVGDSGLQALIEAMEQNQVLTTLSLKYNVFADLSCVESVLRKHNFTLQRLNHSCRLLSENVRRGENGTTISYYLRLNQGGRILLKKDDAPLGLWPIVLERNSPTKNFDAIFFMLRHSSMLLSSTCQGMLSS